MLSYFSGIFGKVSTSRVLICNEQKNIIFKVQQCIKK